MILIMLKMFLYSYLRGVSKISILRSKFSIQVQTTNDTVPPSKYMYIYMYYPVSLVHVPILRHAFVHR